MKKLYAAALFVICIYVANAQVPNWIWAKGVIGRSNGYSNHLCTDLNGNVYFTGFFVASTITFDSITLTNAGSYSSDFFIVKYNPSGNVVWAKRAGGTKIDVSNGISTDVNGNVYVTGFFSSSNITFGSTTLTNAGGSGTEDIFVVKYDSLGNVLWAKGVGGTMDDVANSICTDNSGNVYVTGSFVSSSISFGSTVFPNGTNSTKVFIVKYDASGNAVWAKRDYGTCNDSGNSICTDVSGNVFITGYYSGASMRIGTDTLLNFGGADIFVVKYDSLGNVIWAKSGNGDNWDTGLGISTDNGGNAYVTGSFISSQLFLGNTTLTGVHTYPYTEDFFVTKYDASGNVVWAKNAGGSGSDYGTSISVDTNNNTIYIIGTFNSSAITFGSYVIPNTGPSNATVTFVVKYDSSGNVVWATNPSGNFYDQGYSICVDPNSKVLLSGGFDINTHAFGSTTLNPVDAGGGDIFIAKLNPPCISLNNISTNISCNGGNNGYATQISSNGTAPYTYLWNTGQTTSAITGLSAGNYTVTVTDSFGCSVQNVIAITQPLAISNNLAITNASSCTGNDGKIVATVTGGTPPYYYSWNNGQTTATSTGLTQGTYTLIITDTHSCIDTFITTISCTNDVPAFSLQNDFIIFPNPTSGTFQIQISNGQLAKGELGIYNVMGEKVYEDAPSLKGADTFSVSLPSGLEQGIYFLQVKSDQGTATKKLIINK
ncbi:MAG: T9SS type A sorting domain-containing protein [Bacteroidetes bacterium]|nr:T9SS type A sorting domain-containing protein [Bacteroidota bacterium]